MFENVKVVILKFCFVKAGDAKMQIIKDRQRELFALWMQVKVKLSPFQNDDDDVAREAILI